MNWYDTRSLPVNDEIIEAVLNNPDVTISDLEALCASVANQNGMADPCIEIILAKEGELVLDGAE